MSKVLGNLNKTVATKLNESAKPSEFDAGDKIKPTKEISKSYIRKDFIYGKSKKLGD